MPIDLIEWICRRLENETNRNFDELFMTGGEVTALRGFPDIAERLSTSKLPLGVTTSGWCGAQGSWPDLLDKIPFKKFYVSFGHPDIDTNDAVRGSGSWVRAVQAIRDGVAVPDERGYPEVSVISAVHRQNIRALESLWTLLKDWRVDRWMPAYLEAAEAYSAFMPTNEDLDWLAATKERSPQFDIGLGQAFNPTQVPRSLITTGRWPKNQEPHGCDTLGRLLVVHPNGNIYGCYGSEHAELSLLGHIRGPDFPPFGDLLDKAAGSIPGGCEACPEPIQNSLSLR